jgi:hypothetical protein
MQGNVSSFRYPQGRLLIPQTISKKLVSIGSGITAKIFWHCWGYSRANRATLFGGSVAAHTLVQSVLVLYRHPGHHAVDFGKDRTKLSNVMHLRVTDTIVAVSASSDLVVIPAGGVIDTSDNMNTLGPHPVTYDGRELLVFTRDIRERTVRSSSAEA